ncbi:hypothetical protein GE09DRAFT_391336 [Coniochaeta sp. 2T2.1]|nr:hypothetical protein GE09DRAFT_391336 [Coniochaeta sp. 2T2.1]
MRGLTKTYRGVAHISHICLLVMVGGVCQRLLSLDEVLNSSLISTPRPVFPMSNSELRGNGVLPETGRRTEPCYRLGLTPQEDIGRTHLLTLLVSNGFNIKSICAF